LEPLTLDEATELDNQPKSKKSSSNGNKNKTKRRRSSAKFLRLSGKFEDEDDENSPSEMTDTKLGEMYTKAVSMSQANKINAQNTWSLNLIDNIDRIIAGPVNSPMKTDRAKKDYKKAKNGFGNHSDDDDDDQPQINFAKASCTLDASVKIYSYRVDDVHLSSYKVLANLNRSDNVDEEKKVAKVSAI